MFNTTAIAPVFLRISLWALTLVSALAYAFLLVGTYPLLAFLFYLGASDEAAAARPVRAGG